MKYIRKKQYYRDIFIIRIYDYKLTNYMLEARLSTARHLSLYIPQSFQSQRFRRQSVDYKYRDIFLVFFIIITFILFLLLYIYMTKSASKKIFDEKIPDARVNKLPLRKNRSKKNHPIAHTVQPRSGEREADKHFRLPRDVLLIIKEKFVPSPTRFFWGQTTRASS